MDTTLETSDASSAPATAGKEAALWNPTAAALWSMLLSPAFGAYLHMRNWQRLGQAGKAKQALGWIGIVCLVHLAQLGLTVRGALNGEEAGLPFWVGLGLFGAWCILGAYPQIKYVDEHQGEAYPRRPWPGAIVIALGLLVGFGALTALLAIVVAR